MNDSKEEITVLSEEAEIALEDGEIEEEIEETVVEPPSAVVCDEPDVVDADNDSDVDVCDRLSVKPKKHKHHHKRKRLLSTDEISNSDSRKRPRSDDECKNLDENLDERTDTREKEDLNTPFEVVEKKSWGHVSDDDDFKPSNKSISDDRFTNDNRNDKHFDNKEPIRNDDINKDSPCGSPIAKEKWGADSDEDCTKPSSKEGNNNWVNNDNRDADKSDWGNTNEEKKGWGNSNDDNNKSWGNKNDDNSGWGNKNDDNKGWGNRNDNYRGRGSRSDGNKSWGNKNDSNSNGENDDNKNDWGNRNDNNKGWGNRNDDNSSGYGNRDGGNNNWGNRRGGRNNWGNRNDDGNNRGFRGGRGRNNWRGRNDDNNSWSNRRDDNNSWGNKNTGNDDGGNNNRDSNDWSNKNKDNNDWGNKSKDNSSWGNQDNDGSNDTNKDKNDWGNNDFKDTKQTSNDGDERAKSEEKEVVEKQAWGYDSDNDDSTATNTASKGPKDSFPDKSSTSFNNKFRSDDERNDMPQANEERKNNEPVKIRDADDFGKWGGFDSDDDKINKKDPILQSNFSNENHDEPSDKPMNKGSPENCAKWDYDSDEANNPKPGTFKPQRSFNNDNNDNSNFNRNDNDGAKWNSSDNSPNKNKSSGFSKWGEVNSDDESKNPSREQNNDDDDKGGFGNYGKRNFDQRNNRNDNFNNRNDSFNNRNDNFNNRNDNFNNRNDNFNRNNNRNDNFNRNDNNRGDNFNRGGGGRGGGGGSGKKWPCKYFQMGSCRHGDNCTFIHDSPVKTQSQEPKIQELCRFYEHQECYKRNACTYMHEEFPCKLFHAGSKMCPSGESCKYSHSPLTPETRAMLGRYLDEKIDERTDKSASGSIHDNSDYKANNITPCPEDMIDPYFQDPMQRMYPQGPDPMKFPIRPWNPMMPYGDMPVPPQMGYMQRPRFMMDRYPHPMPGSMMPRGFRGPMNDPYNGNPYSVTPLMPPSVYGKERLGSGSDPYIDNLAQIVVGKDARPHGKMMDPMMDDLMMMDDYSAGPKQQPSDDGGLKRGAHSPAKINSPEVPPGAYVPRNSINAVQPNVRLGSGMAYGGGASNEAAMLYGGYQGHHGADPAMMDYINMAAIHYYHNQQGGGADGLVGGYERPWKLLLLEVPIKIPYPLMPIDTAELAHRHIDPRLRGHPSVLNSGSCSSSGTVEQPMAHDSLHQHDNPSLLSSSLSESPDMMGAASPSLSPHLIGSSGSVDFTEPLSSSYQYRPGLPDSPVFPISDEAFSFLGTDDASVKRALDRSYLQDPRFKRKKAVPLATQSSSEHQASSSISLELID